MKKFLFLFFAFMAYLLLSSKSCAPEKSEESVSPEVKLNQDREVIRQEFGAEHLSSKSLKAYELMSVQKLADFSDYLRIFTNRQMDTTFRNLSGKMIRELFVSDSIGINTCLIMNSEKKKLPLGEFLNRISESNTCDLSFDSIRISRHFRQKNETKYVGCISFLRGLKTCPQSDTVNLPTVRLETEIVLKKVKKSIGNDTLQVWSAFLGNIR